MRRLCDDLRRCARRIGELQCARLVPERAFGKRQKRSINESTSDPASIATARGTNKALRPQTRPSLLTAAAAAVCQACCVVRVWAAEIQPLFLGAEQDRNGYGRSAPSAFSLIASARL